MKKLLFTAAFAVAMSLGFTSCRKCQICTKDSSPEVRLCENDYNSSTEYGLALDVYEGSGYNCR